MVAQLPLHSARLRVHVDTIDTLRALTLPGPGKRTVRRLTVVVERWERPMPGWTGRLGAIQGGVRRYAVRYPSKRLGAAIATLVFPAAVSLSYAAVAAFPLLGITRTHQGFGYPELAVADSAPASVLGLLPTRTAALLPLIPSAHLNGLGLSRAEVGLVGTSEDLVRHQELADDPRASLVRHPLLVQADGHLATTTDRWERPLLDLHVHNPVGRMASFSRPRAPLHLSVHDEHLRFVPTGEQQHGGWTLPLRSPVPYWAVRDLRAVEAIDLRAVTVEATDATAEAALHCRLAELAATGVVLHSLPRVSGRTSEILGIDLADMLQSGYASTHGIARELRSVPQRREAMRRFGGFFELANTVDQLGFRMLPTVTLIVSSKRPDRVVSALNDFAQQTYPHLEITVALHGVDTPVTAHFKEAVERSGARVREYPSALMFGEVLADLARRSAGDLVVKVDDDDFYGPEFVWDLVLAHLYSGADVVGKTTEYLYFEGLDHTVHRKFATETYHTQVAGGAMMLSRSALAEAGGWRPTPNSTDRSVLIRIASLGGIAYRTQSLGYVYVRHTDGHTWEPVDSQLVQSAFEQWPRLLLEAVSPGRKAPVHYVQSRG